MNTEQIDCEIKRETDEALYIYDGENTEWIPKSLVISEERSNTGNSAVIEIPEWLAIEKGLV